MPGSWQINVAFWWPNGPPCVEGVPDVLCGVVECERRKGAKHQSTSKTLHRHVSFVFKVIEFPHFYISVQVPVCFDGEAIYYSLHMQKYTVI